jgi:peptidoglycan L-alanyl-D-glutamate endopeptidase CwlK
MITDELKGLHKSIIPRARKFLELARQECKVKIIETIRTIDKQKAYYSQGRQPIEIVNELRQKAGLPPIDDKNNIIITYSRPGFSFHNYGLAFDCIFYDKQGKKITTKKDPLWKKVKNWANDAGLEWGGNFKSIFDAGHFQYSGGLTINDIFNGKMPK